MNRLLSRLFLMEPEKLPCRWLYHVWRKAGIKKASWQLKGMLKRMENFTIKKQISLGDTATQRMMLIILLWEKGLNTQRIMISITWFLSVAVIRNFRITEFSSLYLLNTLLIIAYRCNISKISAMELFIVIFSFLFISINWFTNIRNSYIFGIKTTCSTCIERMTLFYLKP